MFTPYPNRKNFCLKIPKTRIFHFPGNVTLSVGWHYGRRCYFASLYVEGYPHVGNFQFREFFADTRKEVIGKARLALARGTENIHWDVGLGITEQLLGQKYTKPFMS
jgi:hypothetical protein